MRRCISLILLLACAGAALDLRVRPAELFSLRSGLHAVANRATASPSAPVEVDAPRNGLVMAPQQLFVHDVADASAEAGTLLLERSSAHGGQLTWQSLRGGAERQREKAANLLKRYGLAYVLCSLSLSLVSFSVFYALVSHGVDATALLHRVGITLGANSERFGTLAMAYVLHKAASPIRFAPTVALTAVVGRRLERWRRGGAPSEDAAPKHAAP